MNPLIAITSCHSDKAKGCHDAIRQTWGKDCPVDYTFFLGAGKEDSHWPAFDEVILDFPDDHANVTRKTKAAREWAVRNNYDGVLQVFSDTYVNVPAFLDSNVMEYEYVGQFRGAEQNTLDSGVADFKGRFNYCCGGPGYWNGKRACEVLSASAIELPPQDNDVKLAMWAEDLWVGTVLGLRGIFGRDDQRFRLEGDWYLNAMRIGAVTPKEVIGMHLGRGTGVFSPTWMYQAHAVFENFK